MKHDDSLDFPSWLQATDSRLRWDNLHQLYLYDALDRVTDGECKRLIIAMPPRHGKSETVTIRYSAWRLLKEPDLNIIIGSYNQRLANKFSRRIKRIAENLKLPLAKDTRSVSEWETKSGGGVKAVGVGAGITGFGGGLIMLDDPIKNRLQAESKTFRENVWDWFNDDIYTRLEPDAPIILIQTRWHEDDLAGRLMHQAVDGGEVWDEISLPALARDNDPLDRDRGEALWPERYSVEYLERVHRQQGSYSFSALYQQDPVPADGCPFKREWFSRTVAKAPEGLRWARGYDLAVSTKTTADHTASFRCAFGKDGELYIADGLRKRMEYPEQRRYIIDRLREEYDTQHGIEQALHGQALVQDLRREAASRGRSLRSVKVSGDKMTRALTWAPLAEARKVVLVEGKWTNEFLDEICTFPHGAHDDQVDAVSLGVEMLRTSSTNKSHGF